MFANASRLTANDWRAQDPSDGPDEMPVRLPAEEPEATRQASELNAAGPTRLPSRSPLPPSDLTRPTQRLYSLDEKRRILRQADACKKPGEIAALLRRKGIYHSIVKDFRKQLQAGMLEPGYVAAKKQAEAQASAANQRIAQLERENRRLTRKLEQANVIIDVQ